MRYTSRLYHLQIRKHRVTIHLLDTLVPILKFSCSSTFLFYFYPHFHGRRILNIPLKFPFSIDFICNILNEKRNCELKKFVVIQQEGEILCHLLLFYRKSDLYRGGVRYKRKRNTPVSINYREKLKKKRMQRTSACWTGKKVIYRQRWFKSDRKG